MEWLVVQIDYKTVMYGLSDNRVRAYVTFITFLCKTSLDVCWNEELSLWQNYAVTLAQNSQYCLNKLKQ